MLSKIQLRKISMLSKIYQLKEYSHQIKCVKLACPLVSIASFLFIVNRIRVHERQYFFALIERKIVHDF